METLNIAILDDNKSKISRIKTKFMQQSDKTTNLYEERYSQFLLELYSIDIEITVEEILKAMVENKFDAIIIDYDFTSFARTSNNGVQVAKKIKERFEEYPIFILTAFEEKLFENEIFDAYQIYNYDNYINNECATKEFHSRLIEQILKSRKQLINWENELIALKKTPKENINVEIVNKIIDLDSKIEKAIDGKISLTSKIKEDFYSNKLTDLLDKANKLLEE